jgi:hypothetical protein
MNPAREVWLAESNPAVFRSADVVFCDSIAKRECRSSKALHYRLIDIESLAYISTAMKSYVIGLQA